MNESVQNLSIHDRHRLDTFEKNKKNVSKLGYIFFIVRHHRHWSKTPQTSPPSHKPAYFRAFWGVFFPKSISSILGGIFSKLRRILGIKFKKLRRFSVIQGWKTGFEKSPQLFRVRVKGSRNLRSFLGLDDRVREISVAFLGLGDRVREISVAFCQILVIPSIYRAFWGCFWAKKRA